tara:strand:- start:8961 stop:9350 length:390 start_codon:yes stop_codon:yes gene_type:complete
MPSESEESELFATETETTSHQNRVELLSYIPPTKTLEPKGPHIPKYTAVIGWNKIKVTELLGLPHFRRTDAPAELWQYRMYNCILDLFFYPSKIREMAVNHLETRKLLDGNTYVSHNPQACFITAVTEK